MNKKNNYNTSILRIFQIVLFIPAVAYFFLMFLWLGLPSVYSLIPAILVGATLYSLYRLFFKVAKDIYLKNNINLAYTVTVASALSFVFIQYYSCVTIANGIHIH